MSARWEGRVEKYPRTGTGCLREGGEKKKKREAGRARARTDMEEEEIGGEEEIVGQDFCFRQAKVVGQSGNRVTY